jgi:hypothetical protein
VNNKTNLEGLLTNLKELYLAKDDCIKNLENKIISLEEENSILQKRIQDYEQHGNDTPISSAKTESAITKHKDPESQTFTFSKNKPASRGTDNTEKELNFVKTLQQKYLSGRFSSLTGENKLDNKADGDKLEAVDFRANAKPHHRSDIHFEYLSKNDIKSLDFDNKAKGGYSEAHLTTSKLTEFKSHKLKDNFKNESKPNKTDPQCFRLEYGSYNNTEGRFDTLAGKIYSPSNDGFSNKSENENRNDIKEFLMTVKGRIDHHSFKEFIKYIKILTSKETNIDRNEIFMKVKEIFGNCKDLYDKFEKIIVFKDKK